MVKGDDASARKKNKSTMKKMNRKNDSTATASTRIASITAAKNRRKSGKRTTCQGVCFSPPTREGSFNEKQSKIDIIKKRTKKIKARSMKDTKKRQEEEEEEEEDKLISEKIGGPCLPKFLMLCLNNIENSLHEDSSYTCIDQHDKPLFTSSWGVEFWKCFHSGKDVLETSGTSSTNEQIAWIVSTAADAIARMEKDEQDETFGNSPFLLFLVPSQSKASEVRSVCMALKDLGIHTVSLHQGASIDHQISGLESCEPEFLISTPERLLEIVNLKGVDISGVSLLVIDELISLCKSGYLDAVKSIKRAISSKHQSIVFNNKFSASTTPAVQSLLGAPMKRLSLNGSLGSQASSIIQTVHICASEEDKLQKFAEHLDSTSSKTTYIVAKQESFRYLKALLKLKGLSVSSDIDSKTSEDKKGVKPLACLIDIEQVDTTVMRKFETVLLPDFFPTVDTYIQILTSMARDGVHGTLHSFITKEEAANYQAGELVNVLDECGQKVPDPWKTMYAASMSD
ncbi:unnamed protein product [Cochlearia groenlandica]